MSELTKAEYLETIEILASKDEGIKEIEQAPFFADAAKEIKLAYDIDNTHMGYATMDINDPTRGYDDSTDYTERQQSLLEKKFKWAQEVSSYEKGVAIDINRFGYSIEMIAYTRYMTEQEVLNHYSNGLKKWVEMFFRGKRK